MNNKDSRKCRSRSIGDFIISSTIGHGSSGRVKLGIHQITGEKVAIKIIPRSQLNSSIKITQAVERELAVLQLLDHPNLIDLHQVLQDEVNVYFVTEYMPGGELYHVLNNKGRLSENEARNIFGQIASALSWCHDRNICHRDLKPENILLDKNQKNIKIADFGMATMQSMDSLLKTSCGSPHYASPEIIKGIPYFGPAADVWSAGIILYTLLTGKLPFDDHHVGRLLTKIKTGRFKKIPTWVSSSAKDLIYRILISDPNQRINFNEILSHPWMVPYSNSTFTSHTNNLSIHSFSLQCNPWHDDQLKKPLISNTGGLHGPIRETLKVLWRNLTQDQIVSALMDKNPNLPKLTYYLLLQRQKRQSDYFVERSTDSIEKNSNTCNTVKSSFYNTFAEPCDSNSDMMLGTSIQIDHNVLLTPSLDLPSDITFDGIKNRLNSYSSSSVSPQLQPNRKPKLISSKTSSLTLPSIPQDQIIYPSSAHSSITHFSQQETNNIPINLKIKSTPTLHETLNSVIPTPAAVALSKSLDYSQLKSRLLSSLVSKQHRDNNVLVGPFFKALEATMYTSCRIKNFINNTWQKRSLFNTDKKQINHFHRRKVTRQEFSVKCIAKSEFIAAGKLHYILSEHFQGKLNGCMYPDGKILWSGEIDKSALDYEVQNTIDNSSKTCFLCKIRIVPDSKSLYKLLFIIHREDTRLVASFANELFSLLMMYEQEANTVLKVNKWI